MLITSRAANACSVYNVESFIEGIVVVSRWYWLASIIIVGLALFVHFRRTNSIILPAILVALIIFHPSWTVSPMFGPDCVGQSIVASKLVIFVLVCILVYEFVRYLMCRKQGISEKII